VSEIDGRFHGDATAGATQNAIPVGQTTVATRKRWPIVVLESVKNLAIVKNKTSDPQGGMQPTGALAAVVGRNAAKKMSSGAVADQITRSRGSLGGGPLDPKALVSTVVVAGKAGHSASINTAAREGWQGRVVAGVGSSSSDTDMTVGSVTTVGGEDEGRAAVGRFTLGPTIVGDRIELGIIDTDAVGASRAILRTVTIGSAITDSRRIDSATDSCITGFLGARMVGGDTGIVDSAAADLPDSTAAATGDRAPGERWADGM
jgi:hypothetical protein